MNTSDTDTNQERIENAVPVLGLVRLAGWLIWRERKTLLVGWLAG